MEKKKGVKKNLNSVKKRKEVKGRSKKDPRRRTSRNFVIALSIVSIIGFLGIVFESLFYLDVSGYIEPLWLVVLGLGLILETTVRELKGVKEDGLTSDYLGKITMIVVGGIAIIAGILSLPQLDVQNASFLAVKGIISILAIIFIILQTWITKEKTKNR